MGVAVRFRVKTQEDGSREEERGIGLTEVSEEWLIMTTSIRVSVSTLAIDDKYVRYRNKPKKNNKIENIHNTWFIHSIIYALS